MIELNKKIKTYIENARPEQKKAIEDIIEIINSNNFDFQADFIDDSIVLTKDNNWEHWIFSLKYEDSKVNLYIHKGALIKNHHGILKGQGCVLRHVEICIGENIDRDCLIDLIKQAESKQFEMPMFFSPQ